MKTALVLTPLESRDTPSALFDYSAHAPGTQLIPGYDGPVYVSSGDVNGDGVIDTIASAGFGGGPRVRVLSGGAPGADPVPVPAGRDIGPQASPGERVVQPPGVGDVLYDGFVYAPEFRGGVRVAAMVNPEPGEPDYMVVVPGPGGGSHVRVFTADGSYDHSFLAFDDPNYRGGLFAVATTVDFRVPAPPHPFGEHLLVMPLDGGGPVVAAFDFRGRQLTRFLVGPETDRRPYTFLHGDFRVPNDPEDRRGAMWETPDGETVIYRWDGVRAN